jgi:hypothetical protein
LGGAEALEGPGAAEPPGEEGAGRGNAGGLAGGALDAAAGAGVRATGGGAGVDVDIRVAEGGADDAIGVGIRTAEPGVDTTPDTRGGSGVIAGGRETAGGAGVDVEPTLFATFAAALKSSSERSSALLSEAVSAARRNQRSASTRSPRPHRAVAVERAQWTSSSSSSRGAGIVSLMISIVLWISLRRRAFPTVDEPLVGLSRSQSRRVGYHARPCTCRIAVPR